MLWLILMAHSDPFTDLPTDRVQQQQYAETVVQELKQLSGNTLLLRDDCAEEPTKQLKQALSLAMEAAKRLETADPPHAAMEVRRLAVLSERAKYQQATLNACLSSPTGVLQTGMEVTGPVGEDYPSVEFQNVDDVFGPGTVPGSPGEPTWPSEADPI